MPTNRNNPEKKLIIDEDWKSQVEAEKEAARTPAEAANGCRAARRPPAGPAAAGQSHVPGEHALPARGDGPGPAAQSGDKKADVQLDQAKHSIDMLAMLQQKTEGNRTPEESDELEAALHELRLVYVDVRAKD